MHVICIRFALEFATSELIFIKFRHNYLCTKKVTFYLYGKGKFQVLLQKAKINLVKSNVG